MYSMPSTSTIRDPSARAIRNGNGSTSSTDRVDPAGSTTLAPIEQLAISAGAAV